MKRFNYIVYIILPMLFFIFVGVNVRNSIAIDIDSQTYKFISSFITIKMTGLMAFISFLGSLEFQILFALTLLLIFYKKKKYMFYLVILLLNPILCTAINLGFKYFFHRGRPNLLRLIDITGYSYPSGHSMVSISFYGFIIYICYKYYKSKWKYLIISFLSILIVFIGISRIYLGVHYFSDIIGGYIVGLIWLNILCTIVNSWSKLT